VGTYAYMAPEQASGTEVDARADLYSLGVVAYELCTGRVPFASDSTPALIHDQVYTSPPAPSQVNSRVTGSIETILLKALAKDRAQRYQSGLEFAAALKAAIAQATGEHLTVLYQEAVTLQQRGDPDAAEIKLQELLAIQPRHVEAQILLKEIGRQRESQQRYQQLVQGLMALRSEAANLRQSDPRLPDPDGVLSALLVSSSDVLPNSAALSNTAMQSKPTGERRDWRLLRNVGVILFVLGVITAVMGVSMYGQSLFPNYAVTSLDNAMHEYGLGNLLLGLGIGATVTSVVLLAFTIRRAKS